MTEDTVRIERQLEEAKVLLANQRLLERKHFKQEFLLRGGQYLVGVIMMFGLLSIEFSSTTIGVLGLLVVVSTFVHQTLCPDLKRNSATGEITKLHRLIATVEANIKAQTTETKQAADVSSLGRYVADTLDEIQRSIHLNYALIRRSASWYTRPFDVGQR